MINGEAGSWRSHGRLGEVDGEDMINGETDRWRPEMID